MAEKLPGILAEIADVAGADAAFAILAEYGGTQVTIPAKVGDDHWLVRLVGREKADAITMHFAIGSGSGSRNVGLRHVVIPLGPKSLMSNARRRAARELEAGKDVRAVARDVGVHERTVWRIKKRMKGGQGELF